MYGFDGVHAACFVVGLGMGFVIGIAFVIGLASVQEEGK